MRFDSQRVIYFFEKISEIPRGSGHEKEVSDYIANFAKEKGLFCIQDEQNNIIIKKSASEGYENKKPIIIQGHMDMVCEKEPSSEHDFEKDPLKLIYKGDYIYADKTTLGGDDGIAVAMGMALLDDDSLKHPPLEIVFTTDEEVGMNGANKIDCSQLSAKTIINIDSEVEGVFTASCSGGMKVTSEIPVKLENNKYEKSYKIEMSGFRGGHSGIEIDKQRANANKLMARLLNAIDDKCELGLNVIGGGAKDNAIPIYSYAIISCGEDVYEEICRICKEEEKIYLHEYRNTDKDIKIKISECEKAEKCFCDEDKKKIETAILLMPNGVIALSGDIKGVVETSNNLGIISFSGDKVYLGCLVRSSVITKKYHIYEQIRLLTEAFGGKASYKGNYPSWEYKEDSPIRDVFVKTYEEMFGEKPVIDIIHAGLECGIFSEKIEGADIISLGPNIIDIHTPNEHISISSIERTWNLLLEVLEKFESIG